MRTTNIRSRQLAGRLALPIACLLTSCALFAYGTGRLNPIRVTAVSALTVNSGETNFVALTLPALSVAQAMPAPLKLYPAENLVKPFDRRTVSLRDVRWQSGNAPSGWGWDLAQVTLELRVWQRLGQVWESRAEVFSDLEADGATVYAVLNVPSNTPPGTYGLSATVRLATLTDLRLRISATVSAQGSSSGSINTQAEGAISLQAGGSYRLTIPVGGITLGRFGDLASLQFSASSERVTDRARVRGDEWRIGNLSAPNRWELEWLEGNVSLEIVGRVEAAGPNRLRTEYNLSYTDLQLLLGLRAIAATPGAYSLAGQLEYRAVPVQPIRWTVTVK